MPPLDLFASFRLTAIHSGIAGAGKEISAQKDRLFLWAPAAFGAGIAAYFALPQEPGRYAAAGLLLILAAALYPLYRRHHDSLTRFLTYIAGLWLFLAVLGFMAAQGGTARYGTSILAKSIKFADITGTVESVEAMEGEKGSRAVLTHLTIEKIRPEDTPRKVRLSFRKDDGLIPGARIKTLAAIDPPSGPVMPGAYDFRRHLFFQGIGAVGFSYRAPEIIGDRTHGANLLFENLRVHIEEKIATQAGPVSAGIMSALITGGRGAIADNDDEAMRDSGLYHLLSISGTHVAMVAGVLFFFSRLFMAAFPWVALHWPIKKIAAGIALSGAAFYVLLAGADVPAQRALLMTGLVLIAVMLDRSPISLRLIAFSALVVLAIAPHALIGVSFQMSYAAVAALICFFDYIRPWWMAWHRQAGYLRRGAIYLLSLIITSMIAGGVTGLFSLYHFQSFAVYGVLSNMLAVPLTGIVIMPAAVVAMMLMPFGLEAPALHVMEWGTVWMLAIAHWTAGLDGAVIHVRQWPEITFVCIVVGLTLFLLWGGWRGKIFAAVIIGAGIVAAAFAPFPDVIVSSTGKQAAVRGADGALYVASGRGEKFAVENWQRLAGLPLGKPPLMKDEASPMRCDDHGCRGEIKGWHIAMARTQTAIVEDCTWADVLIAGIPAGTLCPKDGVYDLFGFKDGGAHAFYLGKDDIRVRATADAGVDRPWVIKPRK